MPRPRKPLNIFRTEDPMQLRADLEQLADWLDRSTKQQTYDYARRVRFRSGVVTTGTVVSGHWEAVFVGPPDGALVDVVIPKPQPQDSGSISTVVRTTITGRVHVTAGGAKINGYTSMIVLANQGFVDFLCDGTDYWTRHPHAGNVELL